MILTALVLAATLHRGAEVPVTDPVPNASPYRQRIGAVAASDDVALLVWFEEQQLGAVRIDRDGNRLDVRPIALASAPVHALPDVARGTNNWLVAWSEGHDYGSSLAARFVDDNGVAGEGFTLAELPFPVKPRIAFDGTHFLVAWREDGVMRGARLTAAGQLVEVKELARAGATYGEFDLVALSTGFALVTVHFADPESTVEALRFTTNAELYSYTWLDHTNAQIGSLFALADGDTLVAVWASANGLFVAREHQPIRDLGLNLSPHGIVKIGGTVHLLLRRAERNEAILSSEDGSTMRILAGSSPRPQFTSLAAASFGDRALVATAQHAQEVGMPPAEEDLYTHVVNELQEEAAAPARLAFEPSRQVNPALARRNDRESLAVWLESGGEAPPMLMAMRVDNSGRLLDPAPVSVAQVLNTYARPQVASDGTGYLLVWSDGLTVRTTALRADGTRGPIASLGDTRSLFPCVAWNGTEYLVAQSVFGEAPWFVRTLVQVTRVSRDGKAGAVTTVSGLDQHGVISCASAGGQTLVAWGGPENGVAGTIVRADGTATGQFPINRAAIHLGNVATDGDRFAVTWRGPMGIGWTILTTEGTVSHVADRAVEGYNQQLAASRNGWVLAWQAGTPSNLYAAALDRDGRVLGSPIPLADSPTTDEWVALAGGDVPIAIYMRELETPLHSRWRVFTRTVSDLAGRRRSARH
ncbi:MAG TPA: hypothetical protein VE974_13125 [Thermoanaerobaculia bacterium]|nr:hypothetical protein [Thermoanaerobaculia bacterium]